MDKNKMTQRVASNIRANMPYRSADGQINSRPTKYAASRHYRRIAEPTPLQCFGRQIRLVVDRVEALAFPVINDDGTQTETEPMDFLVCRLKGGQREWLFTVSGIKRYYIDGGITPDIVGNDDDKPIEAVEQDFTAEIKALLHTEIVGFLWCNERGGQKRLHKTKDGFTAYEKAVQENYERQLEANAEEVQQWD